MSTRVSIPGAEVQVGDWVSLIGSNPDWPKTGIGPWGYLDKKQFYWEVAKVTENYIEIYLHTDTVRDDPISDINVEMLSYSKNQYYAVWERPLAYDPKQAGDRDDDI